MIQIATERSEREWYYLFNQNNKKERIEGLLKKYHIYGTGREELFKWNDNKKLIEFLERKYGIYGVEENKIGPDKIESDGAITKLIKVNDKTIRLTLKDNEVKLTYDWSRTFPPISNKFSVKAENIIYCNGKKRTIIWMPLIGYIIIGIFWYLTFRPDASSPPSDIINTMILFLTSGALFLIYELFILNIMIGCTLRKKLDNKLVKQSINLERPIDNYLDSEKFEKKLDHKILVSAATYSTLTSLAFILIVLLIGFEHAIMKQLNYLIIISISLIVLLVSGVIGLIGLDEYDTAADPLWESKDKWKIRLSAHEHFFWCWYLLILGIITALSLVSPLLTLIGYISYIIFRNLFWVSPASLY